MTNTKDSNNLKFQNKRDIIGGVRRAAALFISLFSHPRSTYFQIIQIHVLEAVCETLQEFDRETQRIAANLRKHGLPLLRYAGGLSVCFFD